MRQDKKRTLRNKKKENDLKALIKKTRREPSNKIFQQLVSKLDKAAKLNLIHPNKASRLKSRLSKLIPKLSSKASLKR